MLKLFFIKDIRKSGCSCKYFSGKKKYIATADVENSEIVNYENVTYDTKPSRANLVCELGSVIFAKMMNTIKVLEIDNKNVENIYSTGFYSFKDERILPLYLKYYFESKNFNKLKDKHCKGATMKAINDEELSKIALLIPTISEQEKIVKKLSYIKYLIRHCNDISKQLAAIVKSRFIEMFGDPLINEKRFITKKLIEVCPFNSYKGDVDAIDEKYWLLNLDMIESNTGQLLDRVMTTKDKIGNSTLKFDTNCILYSKLRPYLNKVIIPDMSGYCTTELVYMSVDEKNVNKEYLASLLRSESFVKFINSKTAGAKMPRASMDWLRNFDLILPPYEQQLEYSNFIKLIDKSKYFGGHNYGVC